MKRSKAKPKSAPKRALRLSDLDHTKLSVLNTLGSPQSQRLAPAAAMLRQSAFSHRRIAYAASLRVPLD